MDSTVLPPRAIPVPEMPVPEYWKTQSLAPDKEPQKVTRFIDDHAPSLEGTFLTFGLVALYAIRRRIRRIIVWFRK